MRKAQLLLVIALAVGSSLGMVNCGGDDRTKGDGAADSSKRDAATNYGIANDARTSGADGAGAAGKPRISCPQNTSSSCKPSEVEQYNTCLIDKCEGAYKMCAGDAVKSGKFGGLCGSWMECQNRCSCDDNNCRTACGLPSADCLNCLLGPVQQCTETAACTRPACYGSSVSDGGLTGSDAGIGLPDGFSSSDGFSLSDGFSVPDGFGLPDGFSLSDGFSVPDGFGLPDGFSLSDGFSVSDGFGLPDGFNLPDVGFRLPDVGLAPPEAGSSGGSQCDALRQCCDAIVNETIKNGCIAQYENLEPKSESICAMALDALQSSDYCPSS